MATQLKITSEYKSTSWEIKSEVVTDDVDFPTEVFLWTLDLDGRLKDFQAIGHVDQVAKYPLYDSNRTSNFGIHLVRNSYSVQQVPTEEERDKVIEVLKSAFTFLLEGYEEQGQPIEEYFPAL